MKVTQPDLFAVPFNLGAESCDDGARVNAEREAARVRAAAFERGQVDLVPVPGPGRISGAAAES